MRIVIGAVLGAVVCLIIAWILITICWHKEIILKEYHENGIKKTVRLMVEKALCRCFSCCKAVETSGEASSTHSSEAQKQLEEEDQSLLPHVEQGRTGVPWKRTIPNDRELWDVASLVGKQWKCLGFYLGLSITEIDQIECDNRNDGHIAVVYGMLREWQRSSFHPTLRNLKDAILQSGVDFHWGSEKLHEIFDKSDQNAVSNDTADERDQNAVSNDITDERDPDAISNDSIDTPPVKLALLGKNASSTNTPGDVICVTGAYPYNKGQSISTTTQAIVEFLPRDHINVDIDAIPDSQEPDLRGDIDPIEDVEIMKLQLDDTSPADFVKTVFSEPSVDLDNDDRTETKQDVMKKFVGTMTEYRDQLNYQKEADESLAYINETQYSKTQLNELCSLHGRKADTVSRACDVIVNHLKKTFDIILSSNNEILHIYPAFKVEKENEIIFVVTLSETTDISVLRNAVAYTVEIRVLHKFSNELKTLMDTVHKEGHSISEECQRPIADTIGKWAKSLLETHKYLSVITASPLKSKRNKDRENLQSFVREPECCIVFCVYAKDFIYIKEDPLPTKLNGISTDVMEGAFVTFGRLAHESHDKLPMGCEIGREESREIGTLGGFIDHAEYGLCGITSGHMCLDHAEYNACVNNNGRLMLKQWPEGSRGRGMFQPAKLQNGVEVGQLVELLYQVGSHLESGFDVALFQIENKYPEDGNFPAEKINDKMHDVAYKFKSGNVCGVSRAADKPLWKFGRTSGSTTGKANLKTPTAVKEVLFTWKTHDKFQITLLNQIEVSPIDTDQNNVFANHGDSGALVFIDEHNDDIKCVGMVIGGLVGTSISIISPISPILKHLNVTKFHSFYNTPRQNSEAIQRLEKRLETMCLQLDQRNRKNDENFVKLFTMLEQQRNSASNTSNHEERPST